MFANFELWSGGLVVAEAKPKHARSQRGCLTCRKRKKKCDETRPVCQKCTSLELDCSWPSLENAQSKRSSSSGRRLSIDSSTSSEYALTPTFTDMSSRSSSPLSNAIFSDLDAVGNVIRTLPSCNVLELIQTFDRVLHGAYVGPQFSMLSQSFPVMTESETFLETSISCGAALISQRQPSWERIALEHHSKALIGLARDIQDGSRVAAESTLASIMLLHLFEKFGKSSNSPKLVHLQAAQRIYAAVFRNHIPDTIHQALLIEALIYRVAINSTFSRKVLLSYNYLSHLISTWAKSPALKFNIIRPWRESIWAGLPPELFDIIYKTSFLLRGIQLSDDMDLSSELSILSQRLNALEMQYERRFFAGDNDNKDIDQDFRNSWPSVIKSTHKCVHELYLSAARLLLLKLSNPKLQAEDSSVRRVFSKALVALQTSLVFPQDKFSFPNSPTPTFASDTTSFPEPIETTIPQPSQSPLLLYPLTVLGTAALLKPEREAFMAHVQGLLHICGDRAVSSVRSFLARTWYGEGNNGVDQQLGRVCEPDEGETSASSTNGTNSPGLDVFSNYSILRTVIL